jgi:hypothetical protein
MNDTDKPKPGDEWKCLACGTHGLMGVACVNCGYVRGYIPLEVDDLIKAAQAELLTAVEGVIGEDEKHSNGKKMVNPAYTCDECGLPDEPYTRSELRAEQRQALAAIRKERGLAE